MEAIIQELLAVLTLYRSNFQNLHWNAKGIDFDNAHKEITTDYYEMVNGTIDQIAEMATRNGINPMNLIDLVNSINNSERNYYSVDASQLYSREDIVQASDIMLKDIIDLLISLHGSEEIMNTPINIGFRSTIESIIDQYDLQYRYINKRKMV